MKNLPDTKSSPSLNIDQKEIWAIIPARGGSKRLPRKNVMPFAGQGSLTARTVKTALSSQKFSQVLVSTDDSEIAEEARRAGARLPFLRPAHLADDHASSLDVIKHAVQQLLQLESARPPFAICLLQVTSPLLKPEQVSAAVDKFLAGGFNSLSSMVAVEQFPEWMFRSDPVSGRAVPDQPEGITRPSGAIPSRFIENGALYLVRAEWLDRQGSLYDFSRHGMYLMSREDSVDIDTQADWDYAEMLVRRQESSG